MIKPVTVALTLAFTGPALHAETIPEKQLECLAKNIYHEARGEPRRGQIAVAHVTLNRVAHAKFPDTVCKVVYQPGQFVWTAKKPAIREPAAWKRSKELAAQAVKRYKSGEDVTRGAIFFDRGHRLQPYHTVRTVKIGKHSFYQ